MGYREALKLGKTYEAENPGRFEKNVETGNGEDICAIVYTAGTTEVASGIPQPPEQTEGKLVHPFPYEQ